MYYIIHIHVLHHTHTGITSYTYRYYIIHIQVLHHTHTCITSYTYMYYIIHIQVLHHTHTGITSYTYRYYIIHIQVLHHTHTGITSYTYRYYIIHIHVLHHIHTGITSYTYRYYIIHIQVLHHTHTGITSLRPMTECMFPWPIIIIYLFKYCRKDVSIALQNKEYIKNIFGPDQSFSNDWIKCVIINSCPSNPFISVIYKYQCSFILNMCKIFVAGCRVMI